MNEIIQSRITSFETHRMAKSRLRPLNDLTRLLNGMANGIWTIYRLGSSFYPGKDPYCLGR